MKCTVSCVGGFPVSEEMGRATAQIQGQIPPLSNEHGELRGRHITIERAVQGAYRDGDTPLPAGNQYRVIDTFENDWKAVAVLRYDNPSSKLLSFKDLRRGKPNQ